VAIAGFSALIISVSGFADASSDQNATSSHRAAATVLPRIVFQLAVWISIVTRFFQFDSVERLAFDEAGQQGNVEHPLR